jgi:hypothetical protein
MQLVQARIVTDDVKCLAEFYLGLVGSEAVVNDYYVEIPAGAMTVGFSKRRFTEFRDLENTTAAESALRCNIVLDFLVSDVDREFGRIDRLGVNWVLKCDVACHQRNPARCAEESHDTLSDHCHTLASPCVLAI